MSSGARVTLHIGTWPIEPGQAVWVTCSIRSRDGTVRTQRIDADWERNEGPNSYWRATLGPFTQFDEVEYTVRGRSSREETESLSRTFRVEPKLYLALLWHQHQPIYKEMNAGARGSYLHPWVRLHAIRDYYSMAALVAEHPGVHLTINLTPVLLWQIEDYLKRGATDRALDLTLEPAEELDISEQEQVVSSFFDADWHNQIFPHPRYKELFLQRQEGRPFLAQDIRDLQMWFNVAWFGSEFRSGAVDLATGEVASIQRFVEKGRGFSPADITEMVREQYKILRAVVPIHRALQERGQVEVSTTPFYHPILPLLIDTDTATIDRPGSSLPRRFAHPEDAQAQVERALNAHRRWFGAPPRGMWPAEGAVSESIVPLLGRASIQWIATDRGVLARSGRWGYDADDPDVLCQAYRAEVGGEHTAVFFRDTRLSDRIGFHYYRYDDPERAAREFLDEIKERFALRLAGDGDRVLTVALDGENAWGAYREDARPFLHALYGLLEGDAEVATVGFSEYLAGNGERGVPPHPLDALPRVYDLFTGSWIDENGSLPGVDLGTWIGEAEENRAWELLGRARDLVSGATTPNTSAALEALYAAEGSDWFWWFGEDQASGSDADFDDLFRLHLKNVYRALGTEPPAVLDRSIVPHAIVWTFASPVSRIHVGDRLLIRTNCPGVLGWQADDGESGTRALAPVGGVMAGVRRHQLVLGPFSPSARELRFSFQCTHRGCRGDICCSRDDHVVEIAG
ncbi:MAG: glycoside hydrolase family 57 protein [Gemmatimonadales bacterium]